MTTPPKPTPEQIAVVIEWMHDQAAKSQWVERTARAMNNQRNAAFYGEQATAFEAVAKWLAEVK